LHNKVAWFESFGTVIGIWRDLVHAGRALAKARGFTLVCAVSLGIGMAPVIAISVSLAKPSGNHLTQL
jgi:hypothetical protein